MDTERRSSAIAANTTKASQSLSKGMSAFKAHLSHNIFLINSKLVFDMRVSLKTWNATACQNFILFSISTSNAMAK